MTAGRDVIALEGLTRGRTLGTSGVLAIPILTYLYAMYGLGVATMLSGIEVAHGEHTLYDFIREYIGTYIADNQPLSSEMVARYLEHPDAYVGYGTLIASVGGSISLLSALGIGAEDFH